MADEGVVATDLRVTLGSRVVLDRVSVRADAGEVLVIVGPNGAGKSTLLRTLAGLIEHGGSISLDGKDAATLSPRQRARLVAFVPQRSQLDARLPVATVVGHGRYAHRGGLDALSQADRDAIEDALHTAHVEHLRDREFLALSYGEQRRVLLARALSTQARILLFDEPTASLDLSHGLSLQRTLRNLAVAGRTIIVVLHQLDEALRIADRALLLVDGKAAATGPVGEVITPASVLELYGVDMVPQSAPGFVLPGTD
jgi:iron complex transport system ATP-binding protein